MAAARLAPSLIAAIDSTAVPDPRSATMSPDRITEGNSRTTPRVVACSPVPNAIAGSITIVVAASYCSANQGGAIVSAPTA